MRTWPARRCPAGRRCSSRSPTWRPSTHTLQGEEEKLTLAAQRLQAKVDAFRTKKETIKATYTAAQAQTRIGEAFSGISEEMGDVGLAIQRAEDKTAQLQARAGAIDELLASGALDDPTGMAKDDIQAELDRISGGTDVELELQRMKAELAGGCARSRRSRAARRTGTSQQPAAGHPALRQAVDRAPGAEEGVMIVRIMGEGQVRLADSHLTELNKLDDELLAEMESGDERGLPPHPARPARHGPRARRAAARRLPGALGTDPPLRGRHPGGGPGHAQRRRPDPGLTG